MVYKRAPHSPLPKDFRPDASDPFQVKRGDTWGSVARLLDMDTLELIRFNFHTTDPQEVNWYLETIVGCRETTRDGKNYVFSSGQTIYVPKVVPERKRSNLWFGIAVKGGGHAVIVGKDTVEAGIVSADDYGERFALNIDGWRLGPGLGGGVGLALVVITSMRHPSELQGHMIGGADFQASLGGRWSSVAKGASRLESVARFGKLGKFGTSAAQRAIKIGEWEKLRDAIKGSVSALALDTNAAEPQVTVIDIPGAGTGAELSAYYGVGTCHVHAVHVGHEQEAAAAR